MPSENTTVRMRAWRGLKASGAAVLRDGVYLIPASAATQGRWAEIAEDVQARGGSAYLLGLDSVLPYDFTPLFDRSAEFGALITDMAQCASGLSTETALDTLKQVRKLRKAFAQLETVDFFPGEARRQAAEALLELEAAANRALSPDEPMAQPAAGIERLNQAHFQGRLWATRARPWVDRLACAWLIRRHIDPQARLLWLAQPADCPPEALGFDFDGARFSHVGARVSFETLLASFGLESPALQRLGALVHYLDVGGVQPAEASGVERVLAGLREALDDDDQLLAAASPVFEGLVSAFTKEAQA